tara:strand:- start:215 stop:439 length:225 start_codon:yes stop_codon:yes gene_type:complete
MTKEELFEALRENKRFVFKVEILCNGYHYMTTPYTGYGKNIEDAEKNVKRKILRHNEWGGNYSIRKIELIDEPF